MVKSQLFTVKSHVLTIFQMFQVSWSKKLMTYIFFVGFPYYFIPSPSSAPHFARSEAQQDLGGSGMLRLKPVFQLIEASESRAATDFFCALLVRFSDISGENNDITEVYKSNFWQCGQMEKQRWEESEKRRAEERRSEKRKSEKKEDAGARKGSQVAKHCVFPMICGSGGSKSRLAKAAGAEPSGQVKDEQLHTVVAKHISKSKCKM